MKRILFLDRDGLLIAEPPVDQQVDSLEKLEFVPGVFTWLGKIARETDYELVMVTNQDGLGTASFPEDTFWPAHNKMMRTLANEGICFRQVHIDRSFPHENKPTRKPGTAMLTEYLGGGYDLKNSWVMGDRLTDLELAKNLGARGILFGAAAQPENVRAAELETTCSLLAQSWEEMARFILAQSRTATVHRKTKETDILVSVGLDGAGQALIATGIPFFDHMLEQLARHGLLDLTIAAKGDLHIDEHHTIEDTALTLGESVAKALGDKRGIGRYGFCLPMDDCLAQVAIDFGGRPWLVWEADFKREKIGAMPTEMFFHFFKSFADAARCNLNIQASGANEHHKIEAIFKAFAKAMRMAIKKDGDLLPSTKGTL
jgi:imidazoleglycerol-phosphate dehydratase/histidinol-phosphatase